MAKPDVPDLSRVRTLILAGTHDPIIPAENSVLLADLLRKGGANVTLEMQDAAHGLIPEDLEAARRWLF